MACNYFSHDSNARNSKKIIRLRQKYGAAGYGVYFMILERLREEEGYMSEADYDMISFDLHEDAELIRSVVEDFGLFEKTDDGKYFFSEGFEERMALKDARSKAGKKGASARYCKNENGDGMAQNGKIMANENFAISKNVAKNNLPEFAIGNSFLKESKGKKRKENSSSSFSSSSTSSEKAEEERSEEEQQQEVFLERMFFEKNWAAPNEEMKKFIAFNNTGGRRWSRPMVAHVSCRTGSGLLALEAGSRAAPQVHEGAAASMAVRRRRTEKDGSPAGSDNGSAFRQGRVHVTRQQVHPCSPSYASCVHRQAHGRFQACVPAISNV